MSRERYPGDERRQIYHAWREFPLAMRLAIALGFMLGTGVSAILVAIMRIAAP